MVMMMLVMLVRVRVGVRVMESGAPSCVHYLVRHLWVSDNATLSEVGVQAVP